MTWQDGLNGCYELFAGSLLLVNILALHKDKVVRGVHVLPTAVFASWGFWNLYYYPHLDQWLSFVGGVVMVTLNTFWLGQMCYFNRKEKQRDVHDKADV